jgi:hypothetical protein
MLETENSIHPGLLRMVEDASVTAGRIVAAGTAAAGLLLERRLLGLDCCHLLITGWLLHCHHLMRPGLVERP